MSFGVIVLCAGASRRMGRPKALLRLGEIGGEGSGDIPDEERGAGPGDGPGDAGGETFLGRICRTAREAGAAALVIVVGPPHGAAIRAGALPPGAAPIFAENPDPERGMLSSAQAGAAALPSGLAGALLWPVDIPLVAPGTLRRLVSEADPLAPRLAVPVSPQGRAGHPLWVPAALLPEFRALPAEAPGGLRVLRERHPPLRVLVQDPAILVDADTPAELSHLRTLARDSDRQG